jgi:hypothetical protein
MTRIIIPTIFTKGPKEGKGFSRAELEEAGISVGDTLRLGIPMDKRRSTKHEENVERLKTYMEEAQKAGVKIGRPRFEPKAKRGRVYRGLTSAGKKIRGLRK